MRRILIANRGEVAVAAIAASRSAGWRTVAIVSDVDDEAPHARAADERVSVPGIAIEETYESAAAVLDAVTRCGADAVYAGYGALAEDGDFADSLASRGVAWAGCSGSVLRLAGDKHAVRARASALGIASVPQCASGAGVAEVVAFARRHLPLMAKPSAGHGGKGFVVLRDEASVVAHATEAQRDGEVVYEAFVGDATTVGVTVFRSSSGEAVVLGTRETLLLVEPSLKVLDRSPAAVPSEVAARFATEALSVAGDLGVRGLATVEFLVDRERAYLLEVNPRLPLAYPLVDRHSGLSCHALQLSLLDDPPPATPAPAPPRGVAFEARVFMTPDALAGYPWLGELGDVRLPRAEGVTVHAALRPNRTLYYDFLLAQLVATGETETHAAARLAAALGAFRADGVGHHAEHIEEWVRARYPTREGTEGAR